MQLAPIAFAAAGAIGFTVIAIENDGKPFGAAVIGLAVGFSVWGVFSFLLEHVKEVRDNPVERRYFTPLYILVGAAVVAFALFFLLKPEKPYAPPIHQVPRPVSVSGYTRSDGVYVSPHQRAMPGDRARGNEIEVHNAVEYVRRLDEYKAGRNWALVAAVGVFGSGWLWFRKVRNRPS
jgi:hypothetical protein